eukprot:CAMPEP_0119101036 /NCGR_PEP_ID=MMETSP1180-20130426/171_1 /TAXON_ID=3052 ORGANISM="Chlamydomonas cf sp, Strain CCMP681" /NCGR_SAMPLE_ID=MMETSP1180 /ASSEMBLY_ACC=CAM_ASM_000741 /LENGTH=195 /DNA_ID=CAMNT_0007085063 /DNA_START=44 /DNA_END=631 /DNA_ORIENTATION=+
MKREDAVALAIAVGGPLMAGQLVALPCIPEITNWYTKIRKPKWTPPNWLFGVSWPVLYTAQGVASWLVWKIKGPERKLPLALYGAQLILNLIWQPLMFKAHRPDAALVDAVAMLGMSAAATVAMTRAVEGGKTKGAVAGLMSPYVAWIAFATALTAKIAKDNPNAHKIEDFSAKGIPQPKALKGVAEKLAASVPK